MMRFAFGHGFKPDSPAHEKPGQASAMANADLLDELGLRDYLAERFAIVGTPSDFVSRMKKLRLLGVENIAFAALMPDKHDFLRTFSQDVMPHL